ncbi:MAG: beta-ketoacyl-ACP synthase III [Pseudomonadota bacterium]
MGDTIIAGVGGYLPDRVVTNTELAKTVDTSDEWIRSRSGITQRHFAADDQVTSDLAAAAARKAMDRAGLLPADIGLIIVATVTPDKTFPSTAVFVQQKLGCPPGIAFDVSAACSGFLYALNIAHNFTASGQVKHALIIGAEKLSCFLDWEDRSTAVLFGDGAGALVLSAVADTAQNDSADNPNRPGVKACFLSANGAWADHLYADGGPSSTGTVGHVRMNGREVFRHAVDQISGAVSEALDRGGVVADDIDWFVPHQANIRIIDACAKRLSLSAEKIIVTIDQHANTSSASIPLALEQGIETGRITRGQLLVFAALGGGLAWGSALVRY